jgi:hypothetical protein
MKVCMRLDMQVYVKCLDMLAADDQMPLGVNTTILLAAAALERALGDVRY